MLCCALLFLVAMRFFIAFDKFALCGLVFYFAVMLCFEVLGVVLGCVLLCCSVLCCDGSLVVRCAEQPYVVFFFILLQHVELCSDVLCILDKV